MKECVLKMKTKIALFTANVQGGILQLTLQLYKTLIEEGYDVKVVMPYEVHDIDISVIANSDFLQYHKEKKVINQTPYKTLATRINEIHPQYVWYMDDSVICSNVGLHINSEIKQLLTIHDAGTYHPTNRKSIRDMLLRKYTAIINSFFYKKVYRFILLSSESFEIFSNLFLAYKEKAVKLTLGAHVPEVEESKPPEIAVEKDFLLFFGRIDKYKGIERLLKAYRNVSLNALPLVIAGGGQFTDTESLLIKSCNNLTVINRYIGDGEMKWLFKHMTAAVLPYIEATQSGIIPIAYLFGKPVIVSNVPGLTQFVIDGETGRICGTQEELEKAFIQIDSEITIECINKIKNYYAKNMYWNKNVRELVEKL